MLQYKFYFLDERGHVYRAQDCLLADDICAMENARSLSSKHGVEIWQAARQVARVDSSGTILPLFDGLP